MFNLAQDMHHAYPLPSHISLALSLALSLSLSVYLYRSLSLCLSLSLPPSHSVSLSLSLSFFLSHGVCLSLLCICPSLSLSTPFSAVSLCRSLSQPNFFSLLLLSTRAEVFCWPQILAIVITGMCVGKRCYFPVATLQYIQYEHLSEYLCICIIYVNTCDWNKYSCYEDWVIKIIPQSHFILYIRRIGGQVWEREDRRTQIRGLPCVCTHVCMHAYKYVNSDVHVCFHACLCVFVHVSVYSHSACVQLLEERGNRTVLRFPKCSNPSMTVIWSVWNHSS